MVESLNLFGEAEEVTAQGVMKSPDAYRTIGEAASELDLAPHVLRFWETKFRQIKPVKRGGGRRYYRPADLEVIRTIKAKLYDEGYTIKGVQAFLKEQKAAGAKVEKVVSAAVDKKVLKDIIGELKAIKADLNA